MERHNMEFFLLNIKYSYGNFCNNQTLVPIQNRADRTRSYLYFWAYT